MKVRLLSVLLLLTAFGLAGCGLDSFRRHSQSAGGNPDQVRYASSLGVDLKAMHQTGDGLYLQDLTPGDGPPAAAGDRVSMAYTGWLPDGRKFDSTGEGGAPYTFVLGRGSVIQGWDEGVAGMRVGGVRRLVIPPALGYGATGSGGVIPPNSTLVFEVKMVAMQKADSGSGAGN